MEHSTITFKPATAKEAPRRLPERYLAARWRDGRQWLAQSEQRLAHWAKPEAAFWRLGLLFGLLFLVVTPPFEVPDELVHFYRTYHHAEGHIIPVRRGAEVGAELPRSVQTTAAEVSEGIPFNAAQKQSADKIFAKLATPLSPYERTFVDYRAVALYSPLPYLPQAFGVALGRYFHWPALVSAYLGRLTNLLIALALTWLAIRTLPLMKWGLLLLALTPMAVFQRSSLSADALTNALAFLFIALVVRVTIAHEGRLPLVVVLLIGALAAALCLCKPAYYSLSALCLMIPRARFGGTKRYLTAIAGIFAAGALVLVLWGAVVRGLYSPVPDAPNQMAASPGSDTNNLMSDQVRYLRQHPFELPSIFWNTLKLRGYSYYESFIGVLGWLDTFLPFKLIVSFTLVLLLVALIDGDRRLTLDWRSRGWMWLIFAVSFVAIGISIYVLWTPTGASFIEGMQGRYFIPLSPLLLLPLVSRRWAVDLAARRLHWLLIGYLIVALTVTLWSLLHRYYLPAHV